jgi:hypothetical protein
LLFLAPAGILVIAALVCFWSFRAPPQMGRDEEVLRTMDALFTALTGRNEAELTQCEARLHASREAGQLPPAAAKRIDRLIAQARGGSWEEAARGLYAFIRAQRGE